MKCNTCKKDVPLEELKFTAKGRFCELCLVAIPTSFTPEDLDMLRHPERIFHALLEFPTVPAERKAFLRRAEEKFELGTMTKALYSRVLEIAFEFGVFTHDMRSCIGELSPTDPIDFAPVKKLRSG